MISLKTVKTVVFDINKQSTNLSRHEGPLTEVDFS